MANQLLFAIFNGLASGMAVFLVAAGITIIFGILKILNFAHGAFFMIGAYIAFSLLGDSASVATFLGVALLTGIIVGLLGLVVDFLLLSRLRNVDEAYTLIATYALLLVCNGAVKLVWGIEMKTYAPPGFLADGWQVGPILIPALSLVIILFGVGIFVLLDATIHRTWTGKMVQALAHDPWMCRIAGINVPLLYRGTVMFSFALAGLAGALLLPNQSLSPSLSESYLLQAFIVVIVGGLGNIRGAFLAAISFGLVESLNSVLLPNLPGLAVYVAMVLFLIWRPAGLLAKGERLLGTHNTGMAAQGTPSDDANGRHYGRIAIGLVVVAAVVALPSFANQGFVFLIGIALIEALFALSWNLLFGYTGLAVFGHAGLFAIGAYFVGYLVKTSAIPFLALLTGGALAGGVIAFIVGLIAVQRTAGIALAILTMALGEILRSVIGYMPALGSDDGLSSIPRPAIDLSFVRIDLSVSNNYYWFLCIVVGLVTILLWLFTMTATGRVLRCIRQDPERTAFLGVPVGRYRLLAFTISGSLAALAGGLQACWAQILTPDVAGYVHSTQPMLNSLLGGAEYFLGPAIGSGVFVLLSYSTRSLAGMSEIISGGALLLVILLAPGGLLSILGVIRTRPTRKASVSPNAARVPL